MLVSELRQVHGSDLEAVDESFLVVDPDAGQAGQTIYDHFSWLPLVAH